MSKLLREVATFGLVGVTATLVHVSGALLTRHGFGAPPLAANLAGYCFAVSVSYLGNARFTFAKPIRDHRQAMRFVVTSLLCLGLNQLTIYLLVYPAGWRFGHALLVGAVVVPAASFALSKLWAFAGAHGRAAPQRI